MKNWYSLTLIASLAAGVPALASCGSSEDDLNCEEGKCDDVPDSQVPASPCDGKMVDKSGAGHKKVAGRLNDPLAQLAFRTGSDCPTNLNDLMAKLRKTDNVGCAGERDGLTTRMISETAQASGTPTNYRAVTTRTCNGRETHEMIFSIFGIRAGATSLPQSIEMIAFDKTSGIFNYYEADGSKINFFGNSKDLLKGPGSNDDRRCANCHVEGGLVMKELDTPWMHWEGHENTPGIQELVTAHSVLGSKSSGAELEGLVKRANTQWNKAKIAHLKSLTANGKVKTKDLLKPLFCSPEINIDNGADFGSPIGGGPGGSELNRVPFDALLDPQLAGFGSINVTFSDYDALIKQNGQRVDGLSGAIDTLFDLAFIERSHIDNDLVEQLKSSGILDDDFVKDVVMVDFTRPVFSDARCGLLSFVPDLAAEDLTPAGIRGAVIAALQAESPTAGSPAGVLLANLQNTGDAADHKAKVDAFTAACSALGSRTFLQNFLAITSLNREQARERPVLEFMQTLPTDDQSVAKTKALDPVSCQLVDL